MHTCMTPRPVLKIEIDVIYLFSLSQEAQRPPKKTHGSASRRPRPSAESTPLSQPLCCLSTRPTSPPLISRNQHPRCYLRQAPRRRQTHWRVTSLLPPIAHLPSPIWPDAGLPAGVMARGGVAGGERRGSLGGQSPLRSAPGAQGASSQRGGLRYKIAELATGGHRSASPAARSSARITA